MLIPGDVISYYEMCREENMQTMQRGVNYHLRGKHSVILMSVRRDAPYTDRIEQNGNVLIYEGHDIPQKLRGADPKKVDQQLTSHTGNIRSPELVKVYEKVLPGVWVYNGLFSLTDAWQEYNGTWHVFKFRMEAVGYVAEAGCRTRSFTAHAPYPHRSKTCRMEA